MYYKEFFAQKDRKKITIWKEPFANILLLDFVSKVVNL